MNTQFYHQITPFNFERFTIAIATPDRNSFENMLSTSPVQRNIPFLFGKSLCSDSDRYVKSIGRELAKTRMTSIMFQFDKVMLFEDHATYFFSNDGHDLVFRVHYTNNRVWLMRAQTKGPKKD